MLSESSNIVNRWEERFYDLLNCESTSDLSVKRQTIQADIFKCGGTLPRKYLLELEVLGKENFKDAVLIPLYKNKGERHDCGNYRGISHVSCW